MDVDGENRFRGSWNETRSSLEALLADVGARGGLLISSTSKSGSMVSSPPAAACFRRKLPMRRLGGSSLDSPPAGDCGGRFLKLNDSPERDASPPGLEVDALDPDADGARMLTAPPARGVLTAELWPDTPPGAWRETGECGSASILTTTSRRSPPPVRPARSLSWSWSKSKDPARDEALDVYDLRLLLRC